VHERDARASGGTSRFSNIGVGPQIGTSNDPTPTIPIGTASITTEFFINGIRLDN